MQDRAVLSQSLGAAEIPIRRESVTTQPLATSYRSYRVSLFGMCPVLPVLGKPREIRFIHTGSLVATDFADALKFNGAPEKVRV